MVNPCPSRFAHAMEFVVLFIAMPMALFFWGSRLEIYLTLWGAGLVALAGLMRQPEFSWHGLWHGQGWSRHNQNMMLARFVALALVLALVTYLLLPERFMRFPLDRFALWLAVMGLYPILSIIPQELFFRSFYFARYGQAFTEGRHGILMNGLMFGLCHVVLNNWIAPSFCAVGGLMLAHSYQKHHSLKWAVIEHSLYGCWVFTVGIGWYFFTGNWRH